MIPDSGDSRSLTIALAVVAMASFVFYRSVVTVFFAQDDFPWLWAAQHLSVDQLIRQFASRYEGGTYVFWRPLSQQVWFWLNLRFWGTSAELFHLSSLVFHALNSILAFLVARSLLKNTTWAAVTGILYGTNPVHFQAVAWPAAFTEIGSSFLVLLSFLAYLHFAASGFTSRRLLWASLAAFVGALMSKEPSVILPVIVVVHLATVGGRALGEIIRSSRFVYAFALLSGLYLLRLIVVGLPPPGAYSLGFGLSSVESALRYAVWGVGVTTPMLWRLLGTEFKPTATVLVVVGLMAGFLLMLALARWGRRYPVVSLGLAWFVAFLAPALLVSQRAPYYASLPSFGLMLILAYAAMQVARSRAMAVLVGLALVLVIAVRFHAVGEEYSANPVPYMGKLAKQTLINIDRLGGLDDIRVLYLVQVPDVERWAYGFEWMFRVYYPGIRRVKYVESREALPEAAWKRADAVVLSIENAIVTRLSLIPVPGPKP